jgi:hypothetical protein
MMRGMPVPPSVGSRPAASVAALALLAVLSGACVHRVAPTRGDKGLVFWAPRLPLAEGLFDTFEIRDSADDCGRNGIPGLDCTMKRWDFEGTTLEVLPPPGFEVVAQGLERNHWFSLRCVSAPASGSAQVRARVRAAGKVRYEGATSVSCQKAARALLMPSNVASPEAGGFSDTLSGAERGAQFLRMVVGSFVLTDLQLHAGDGTRLYGYGWELTSPGNSFGLHEAPTPPTSPGLVPVGPRVRALAPGKGARLRIGVLEVALPFEAVPDEAWKLALEWKTDARWTRLQATAHAGKQGRVYGLGGCSFRITSAQGTREDASPGPCDTQLDVGHTTRVCVRVRGREQCR